MHYLQVDVWFALEEVPRLDHLGEKIRFVIGWSSKSIVCSLHLVLVCCSLIQEKNGE